MGSVQIGPNGSTIINDSIVLRKTDQSDDVDTFGTLELYSRQVTKNESENLYSIRFKSHIKSISDEQLREEIFI